MNKKFYQLKRDGWYLLELREIKADAFDKLEGWYVEESNVRIIIFGTRKRWDSGELGYLYRQKAKDKLDRCVGKIHRRNSK